MKGEVIPIAPDGRRVIENAVVRLLKAQPFYGHFLMNFCREIVINSHPVGVTIRNGTPVLAVDPDRLSIFNYAEQQALLEHGIKHILHLHPARRKACHPRTWDVATDLAINLGIDDMPGDALVPAQFKLEDGLAAEEYARLLTRTFETGNLEGDGTGSADPSEGGKSGAGDEPDVKLSAALQTIDNHALWSEADSTPERLAEQVVRDMVVDAHRKSGGEVPEDVRVLVEEYLRPPAIPWHEILRQFIATAGRVGRQSTWKREHRRFAHDTPGNRKRKRLNLLVGIDTSESTDILELREAFARELLQIARGRDCRFTVLYANSRIRKIDTFSSSNIVAEVYIGGGFTDLRPVFDYARTMQPLPTAIIYLTDGYGPAPETMEFPTLWALTIDGKKPVDWGVELRLQV